MALILGSPAKQPTDAAMSPQGMPAGMADPQFQGQKPMQQPQQKKSGNEDPRIKEMAQDISSMTRRFRVLEERYINMRKRVQLMDQNILANNKKVINEVKTAEADIADMRRKISDIKEKFILMAKELDGCAKKSDVEVVRRYISLWNPTNFVTQEEAEKLVRQVIEAEKTGKSIEKYPVYEPEDENNESEEKHEEAHEEEEEIKEPAPKLKKPLKKVEKKREEIKEEEYKPKTSKKDDKKVDLDDITNILHRHSPRK